MLRLISIFLACFSTLTHAWVCPTNFNDIGPGDSVDQITERCGKPDIETHAEAPYRGPQEWQYYLTINNPLIGSGAAPGSNPTVKMTIAFMNNKVINITMQGTSLSSTTLCGPTISVGDTDKSIEKNCGKPVFIQKQDQDKTQPVEITEFKYNTTPPNILVFENGILKDRR